MIKNFLERVSIRDFNNQKMLQEDIELITQVINNSPTSTNTQQFSAIIITDQGKKDIIAKNNWNQKHISESAAFILFIADRTRVRHIIGDVNMPQEVLMYEFMRATVDATIAATYAHDALLEIGYGVTMVGGVSSFGNILQKELKLPDTSFVVVGLSLGKATRKNPIKPKLNKVFINEYDFNSSIESIKPYDELLTSYYKKQGIDITYISDIKKLSKSEGGYFGSFKAAGEYFEQKLEEFK